MSRLIGQANRRFAVRTDDFQVCGTSEFTNAATARPCVPPDRDGLVGMDAERPFDSRHVAGGAVQSLFCCGTVFETGDLIVFRHARLTVTGGAQFSWLRVSLGGHVRVVHRVFALVRSVHRAVCVDMADNTGDTVLPILGSQLRHLADTGDQDRFGGVARIALSFPDLRPDSRLLGRSDLPTPWRASIFPTRARLLGDIACTSFSL